MAEDKIRIRCPRCRATGSGGRAHIAQAITCPKCRRKVHMERVRPDTLPEPERPTETQTTQGNPPPRQAQTEKPDSSPPPLWLLAKAFGSIVCGVLALCFLFIVPIQSELGGTALLPKPLAVLLLWGFLVGFAYAAYRLWPPEVPIPKLASRYKPMYCTTCGTTAKPKRVARGNFMLELVIWLVAIAFAAFTLGLSLLIALMYTLSRAFGAGSRACGACGAQSVIPTNSPHAVAAQDHHPQ